jgi:hypothetical protein
LWSTQLGTSNTEWVRAITPDGSGGWFVCGYAEEALGSTYSGGSDAWVARYDGSGSQLWLTQWGSSSDEEAFGLAPDSSGGTFVCGYTAGSLAGTNAGEIDAWLARVSGSGAISWQRQWGSSTRDNAFAAASDGQGGVLVAGSTNGVLAVPGLGGFDAWLASFDALGNQVWIRQFGSAADDFVYAAAPDGNASVYLAGTTLGSVAGANAGYYDAWVAHIDATGSTLWTAQLGTSGYDAAFGLVEDGASGVRTCGQTAGSLGAASAGGDDYWLARYVNPCTAPTSYCTANSTSGGCVATMAWSGAPSLSSPSGFGLTSSQIEPQRSGIQFFGATGAASVPFANGFLCVQSPRYRLAIQNSGGSAACSGTFSYTLQDLLNHPTGGGSVMVGRRLHVQTWCRDPAAPSTIAVSNALTFVVCP